MLSKLYFFPLVISFMFFVCELCFILFPFPYHSVSVCDFLLPNVLCLVCSVSIYPHDWWYFDCSRLCSISPPFCIIWKTCKYVKWYFLFTRCCWTLPRGWEGWSIFLPFLMFVYNSQSTQRAWKNTCTVEHRISLIINPLTLSVSFKSLFSELLDDCDVFFSLSLSSRFHSACGCNLLTEQTFKHTHFVCEAFTPWKSFPFHFLEKRGFKNL